MICSHQGKGAEIFSLDSHLCDKIYNDDNNNSNHDDDDEQKLFETNDSLQCMALLRLLLKTALLSLINALSVYNVNNPVHFVCENRKTMQVNVLYRFSHLLLHITIRNAVLFLGLIT